MVKLSPIFDPIKQASRSLYSKYCDKELAIILDFVINCNKMTQQITTNMKGRTSDIDIGQIKTITKPYNDIFDALG